MAEKELSNARLILEGCGLMAAVVGGLLAYGVILSLFFAGINRLGPWLSVLLKWAWGAD